MDVLTYDELRVLEREERDNNKLSNLDDDFIDRFQSYVNDKQRVMDKGDDNVIASRVKERTKIELINARNSFKRLFEYRSRKVFNQVLIDLRMGVKPDFAGFLVLEKDFYDSVRQVVSSYFNQVIKRKLKKPDEYPEVKDDNVLVRFVRDFPEFAWDDKTLGPFIKEDVANLPQSVVNLLLKKEVIKVMLNDEEEGVL